MQAFTTSCCEKFRHELKDQSGPVYKLATKKQVDAAKESEAVSAAKAAERRIGPNGGWKEFACAQCSELSRGVTMWEVKKHLTET